MSLIVSKFGGSSLADAKQVRKAAKIIAEDTARRVIVVSAPGKRYPEDVKITDMLIECHKKTQENEDPSSAFAPIRQRFMDVAKDLGIASGFDTLIDMVEQNLKDGVSREEAVSRGEFLCAHLMSRFLKFEFIDSSQIIRFTDDGHLDERACMRLVGETIDPRHPCVIPGFYGTSPNGTVMLLARGGSDITAALVARGTCANLYENWTDVSGLLTADPNIVENPAPIREISYVSLGELAFLGVAIFHQEAVAPVEEVGIPINIRNTNEPDHPGTLICVDSRDRIGGVASKSGVLAFKVVRDSTDADLRMIHCLGEVFANAGVPMLQATRSRYGVLAVVDGSHIDPSDVAKIIDIVKQAMFPWHIETIGPLALVGAIDAGIGFDGTRIAPILTALTEAGIVPRLVFSGDSEQGFFTLVDEGHRREAVCLFYNSLHGKN